MNCGASSWPSAMPCGFGSCCRGATCRCWPFMSDGVTFTVHSRCGSKCRYLGKVIWSSPIAIGFISRSSKRHRFSTLAVSSATLTLGANNALAQTTPWRKQRITRGRLLLGTQVARFCPFASLAPGPAPMVHPPLEPQASQKIRLTLTRKRHL